MPTGVISWVRTNTEKFPQGFGFIDGTDGERLHFHFSEVSHIHNDGDSFPLPRGAEVRNMKGYDVTLRPGDHVWYHTKRCANRLCDRAVGITLVCGIKKRPIKRSQNITRGQKNMLAALFDTPLELGGIPHGALRKSIGTFRHLHADMGVSVTYDQAKTVLQRVRKDHPKCAAMLRREFGNTIEWQALAAAF